MNKAKLLFLEREVVIMEKDKTIALSYLEIEKITCDKPYVHINTSIGKRYTITQNLKSFSDNLPPFFIQCNKSICLNLAHTTSVWRDTGGFFLKTKNFSQAISRRRSEKVQKMFLEIRELLSESDYCNICKMHNKPLQKTNSICSYALSEKN